MEPVPPANMKTSWYPRKAVGYDQSWICASWTGPFISFLSRCSHRSASSDASVPKIGLQQSTRRTCTPMCRSFHATGHSCRLRSKDGHISTRSCPSGCPCRLCLPESCWGSPCFCERTGHSHSQLLRNFENLLNLEDMPSQAEPGLDDWRNSSQFP